VKLELGLEEANSEPGATLLAGALVFMPIALAFTDSLFKQHLQLSQANHLSFHSHHLLLLDQKTHLVRLIRLSLLDYQLAMHQPPLQPVEPDVEEEASQNFQVDHEY
jgi:hypothetical protein